MSTTNIKRIFIDKTLNKKNVGLFCDICTFILKSSDDEGTHREFGCCYNCFLHFIEARKYEWSKGWRPSQEVVDLTIKEKSRIFIK